MQILTHFRLLFVQPSDRQIPKWTHSDLELLRGEVVLEPVAELALGLHLHLLLLVLEISPKTDFFENNR